jgi:hypothetical protein
MGTGHATDMAPPESTWRRCIAHISYGLSPLRQVAVAPEARSRRECRRRRRAKWRVRPTTERRRAPPPLEASGREGYRWAGVARHRRSGRDRGRQPPSRQLMRRAVGEQVSHRVSDFVTTSDRGRPRAASGSPRARWNPGSRSRHGGAPDRRSDCLAIVRLGCRFDTRRRADRDPVWRRNLCGPAPRPTAGGTQTSLGERPARVPSR